MKKVLVTGSTGLVGSQAMSFFKNKRWEPFGIDVNMRSHLFNVEAQRPHNHCDIRDYPTLAKIFQEHKFDAIIHTAAQPSHDWSKKDPLVDFSINAKGTLNLLELTRQYCPEAVFIHVSTDKVYGSGMRRDNLEERLLRYHHDVPFDENTPFEAPFSPFGVSKLCADLYVQEYGKQWGLKTACFRCGCITGQNHKGAEMHGFLAYLAECAREGKEYHIFGHKGKQVRDQIHAYDLVNAFWHVIQNPKVSAVYNMGGGPNRSISVLEAITWFENRLFTKMKTTMEKPRFADRVWDVHDVSKFKADYPEWDYQWELEHILTELCFEH